MSTVAGHATCDGATGGTARARRAARACTPGTGTGEGAGPASTLGGLLERASSELRSRDAAHCPVCGDVMRPAGGPVVGRCRGCGSLLA